MDQIRSIGQIPGLVEGQSQVQKKSGTSFAEAVKKAIEEVSQVQNEAEKAIQSFAKGEVRDVHTVVLAMEKADVSLQVLLQVRNKLLNAYEEIMRMQV
ncbi:MAG: flagellar hook-basal body complex protein FliE [Deltaproteobacteria bacterium]|nr:MAG: flagellar hook-basal body complex protein FliE [Deltaproteobacteria bacterium]